jgi:hypothetical protein
MASQGDALVAAVAQPETVTLLAALPHALLLEVLSRVPVDCRLRCAECNAAGARRQQSHAVAAPGFVDRHGRPGARRQ